jgi:beta-glucanase (GH16 family)
METTRNPSVIRQTMHMSRSSKPKEDAPYGLDESRGETTLGQPRDQSYHRYGVYFDQHVVQFYVDRKPTLRFTSQDAQERDRAWPFDRPMFLLLSVAVLGKVDNTRFPAAMSVDHISIWGQGVPF